MWSKFIRWAVKMTHLPTGVSVSTDSTMPVNRNKPPHAVRNRLEGRFKSLVHARQSEGPTPESPMFTYDFDRHGLGEYPSDGWMGIRRVNRIKRSEILASFEKWKQSLWEHIERYRNGGNYPQSCRDSIKHHLDLLPEVNDLHLTVNPWKDAVDDMLTVLHSTANNDPRDSIGKLIHMNEKIALDPCVSKDAVALVKSGRDEVLNLDLTSLPVETLYRAGKASGLSTDELVAAWNAIKQELLKGNVDG